MKKIVVWYNPTRDVYYHHYVNNFSSYCPYERGYVNSYGHIIVHIIEPNFEYYGIPRVPLRKRCIDRTISFLNHIR